MQSRLEGAYCPHCQWLSLHTLHSRKALFEEGVFTSVPRGAGPTSAEAERWLCLWESQMDQMEGMKTGEPLSSSFPIRSSARSLGWEARPAFFLPGERAQHGEKDKKKTCK